jgi:4-diphosphocytidyl-2-C-methyl-D-erythritol kinase
LPRTSKATAEPPLLTLVRHAPAKINLALHVVDQRSDGYHLLESLIVFARAGDRVTASLAETDWFSVSGPFADEVPRDRANLILCARDRLREVLTEHATATVSLTLEKNLPVASGIGGGSSDAAAALRALAALWEVDQTALPAVAAPLGADLPMCLAARPLMARGIGERLEILPDFPSLPIVLVNPGVAVSTPEVFRALASRQNPPLPFLPPFSRPSSGPSDHPPPVNAERDEAVRPTPPSPRVRGEGKGEGQCPRDREFSTPGGEFRQICDWLAETRNDLQIPAIAITPVVADVFKALQNTGAAFARMSGSGATCFGLFATHEEAAEAATAISERHPAWWVVATKSFSSEDQIDEP